MKNTSYSLRDDTIILQKKNKNLEISTEKFDKIMEPVLNNKIYHTGGMRETSTIYKIKDDLSLIIRIVPEDPLGVIESVRYISLNFYYSGDSEQLDIPKGLGSFIMNENDLDKIIDNTLGSEALESFNEVKKDRAAFFRIEDNGKRIRINDNIYKSSTTINKQDLKESFVRCVKEDNHIIDSSYCVCMKKVGNVGEIGCLICCGRDTKGVSLYGINSSLCICEGCYSDFLKKYSNMEDGEFIVSII